LKNLPVISPANRLWVRGILDQRPAAFLYRWSHRHSNSPMISPSPRVWPQASPPIPSLNQITEWLEQMDGLKLGLAA